MATVGQLKTKIQRYIIDLTEAVSLETVDWINEAIRAAEDRYNFRVMEEDVDYVTAPATRLLGAIPDDWKEARQKPILRVGQDGELGVKRMEWASSRDDLLSRYDLDPAADTVGGEPVYLLETERAADAASPGELHVYPLPDANSEWDDGNWRIKVPYWKYLATLTSDSQSNWFTRNAELYVLNWATARGMQINHEEQRAQGWFATAEIEFQRLLRQDKRSRLPDRIILTPRRGSFSNKDRWRR